MLNPLKYIQMIPTAQPQCDLQLRNPLRASENLPSQSIPSIRQQNFQPFLNFKKNLHSVKYVLVFDIDYCLYNNEECKKAENLANGNLEKSLIQEWIQNKSKAKSLSISELKSKYGSSREGIHKFYGKDMEFIIKNDFNEVEKFIGKNTELIKELESIPYEKHCFTNAFPLKAKKILQKLEVEHCFKSVFCSIDDFKKHNVWITKPKPDAYRFVQSQLKLENDTQIVFFDDRDDNIKTARSDEFKWIAYHVTPGNDIISRIKQFKREHLENREQQENIPAGVLQANPPILAITFQ